VSHFFLLALFLRPTVYRKRGPTPDDETGSKAAIIHLIDVASRPGFSHCLLNAFSPGQSRSWGEMQRQPGASPYPVGAAMKTSLVGMFGYTHGGDLVVKATPSHDVMENDDEHHARS
jgi:hypothetical protein